MVTSGGLQSRHGSVALDREEDSDIETSVPTRRLHISKVADKLPCCRLYCTAREPVDTGVYCLAWLEGEFLTRWWGLTTPTSGTLWVGRSLAGEGYTAKDGIAYRKPTQHRLGGRESDTTVMVARAGRGSNEAGEVFTHGARGFATEKAGAKRYVNLEKSWIQLEVNKPNQTKKTLIVIVTTKSVN